MKNTPYTDIVMNAFKAVQAWKTTTIILLLALVFETIALGWLAGQRSVLLVPPHLGAGGNKMQVNLADPYSPDYLTQVAKGDAYTLLNWTPESIESQYGLFVSRLSAAVHDAQREVLITESKRHQEEGLTQSFYVTRSFVKESTVTLHGVLVRSMGGREVFRGPAVYEFVYQNAGNGYLQVAGVSQPANSNQQ